MLTEQIEMYFHESGIGPKNYADFGCKFKKGCLGKFDSKKLAWGREPFISTGYEEHRLPRLLILSLHSAAQGESINRRKAGTIRDFEEHRCKPTTNRRTKHWREVHEIALNILSCFENGKGLTLENIHNYFAHTNSAKCSLNHGKQPPERMFENCQSYLPKELTILAPDILISQGDWAAKAVKLFEHENLVPLDGERPANSQWFSALVRIGNREVFWLRTAYFGARQHFFKAELDERYRDCARAVQSYFRTRERPGRFRLRRETI